MEKERYELLEDSHIIYDFKHSDPLISLSSICDLLNQQDARIKELEEALKKANTNNYLTDYYLVEKENQQLKQSQKQLAIEVLKKISPSLITTVVLGENRLQMEDQIDIIINNEIEELRGEENEKG